MKSSILCWTVAMACCTPLRGEEIEAIATAWSHTYGNFGSGGSYHYRCVCKVTIPVRERPMDTSKVFFDVPTASMELFRLGNSVRGDSVSADDLSLVSDKGMRLIFTQGASYSVQKWTYAVLPPHQSLHNRLSQGLPYVDPLSDALGLDLPTSTWRIGNASSHPFHIASALQTGCYEISSRHGNAVTLTAKGIDEVVLDSSRDFAVLQRRWNWEFGKPVKCVVVNDEWAQFPQGTWYPQASTFQFYPDSIGDDVSPLLTAKIRIEALPPPTEADFDLVADRPGATICLHKNPNGINNPMHSLEPGERIRLADVASGKVVIPTLKSRVREFTQFRFTAVKRAISRPAQHVSVVTLRILGGIAALLAVAAIVWEIRKRPDAER